MKFKKNYVIACLVLVSFSVFALQYANVNKNSISQKIIGKWVWVNDCKTPDFIIKKDTILFNTDADGEPITFKFKNVKYIENPIGVTAQLKTVHGISGTESQTSFQFRVKDNSHITMIRKKIQNIELIKCE